ncbi:MAG: ABC transporter ATP-binding protein [Bdellovibrionales bacterium CG10_big_fil_rev_8_21_14_0_10_45_34]|nr:MAG: ABC transporter ATP-binding protein [Bdellovibrionales bacterium CG10_big_fil_rev_8_21_14_0_10_45_34]
MRMIEAKNLSILFGRKVIFENLNLSIEKGERFTLIGPSGAGKSVLLKSLCGVLKPASGTVTVDGISIYEASDAERNKILRKIGVLFQKNALFDSLTAIENVCFPLREVTTLQKQNISEIGSNFLEAVGLAEAAPLMPSEMSGGMQKRLGIARALALRPQIIFYDDPTAGLDPITSKKIIDLILGLQKKDSSTVLAITNDMNRAFQMNGRIAMLVDGELIVSGGQKDILDSQDPRVYQFVRGLRDGPLSVRSAVV